jgi:pimeloyl-ACP methyl ester carboxylesterase
MNDNEVKTMLWFGFECETFEFAGREAFIVHPSGTPCGKLLLKTEYMDAFPAFDIAMLEKGWYLIHVQHKNRWATDDEIQLMADFVRHCAQKLDVPARCALVGLSCGGLQAARFAARYPELTAVLYLDAPVLSIPSMAGTGVLGDDMVALFWPEIAAAYGLDRADLAEFRRSPVDELPLLIQNRIPVVLVYGDADTTVIWQENGKILADFYKENGGELCVIAKPGVAHHPHGLEDPTPVVEFVQAHC